MKKIISIIAIVVQCWLMPAWAQNELYLPNVRVIAGERFEYEVQLENADEITAVQFEFYLYGEELTKESFSLTERAKESHKLEVENGRVIIYSDKNECFSGNRGAILKINTSFPPGFEYLTAGIEDISMVKPDDTQENQVSHFAYITPLASDNAAVVIRFPYEEGRSIGELESDSLQFTAPVTLRNQTSLTALQMDISSFAPMCPVLDESLRTTHVLEYNKNYDGYRILIYSPENKLFPEGEYTLMNLNVKLPSHLNLVNYLFDPMEVMCTSPSGEAVDFSIESGSIRILPDKNYIPVERVDIIPHELNIGVGETYQLLYRIYPQNATNQKVEWAVEDTTIAKVDTGGLVTALKKGTTWVYVWDEMKHWSSACLLVVTNGTNLDEHLESKPIRLYPVFAKDILNVTGLQSGDELSITDFSGVVIRKLQASAETMACDVADLPKGCYFMQVFRKGKVVILKFIK